MLSFPCIPVVNIVFPTIPAGPIYNTNTVKQKAKISSTSGTIPLRVRKMTDRTSRPYSATRKKSVPQYCTLEVGCCRYTHSHFHHLLVLLCDQGGLHVPLSCEQGIQLVPRLRLASSGRRRLVPLAFFRVYHHSSQAIAARSKSPSARRRRRQPSAEVTGTSTSAATARVDFFESS